MEVHHHTHPGHGKKTWKEYSWEFLMLFLAVFCGFLAEYKLEHVIEKQRETKYMQALLEETQLDIMEYDKLLSSIHNIDPIADSLFYNVKNAEKFGYSLMGKWNAPFNNVDLSYFPSLTAIRQLQNSGNLRLIDDADLLRQIVVYETFVEGRLQNSYANVKATLRTSYQLQNKLCDLTDFNKSLTNDMNKSDNEIKNGVQEFELPLLVKDPVSLNELASSFVDFRGYLNWYMAGITQAKLKAMELNRKITEEYHLN